jgi:hypothetical protein
VKFAQGSPDTATLAVWWRQLFQNLVESVRHVLMLRRGGWPHVNHSIDEFTARVLRQRVVLVGSEYLADRLVSLGVHKRPHGLNLWYEPEFVDAT